MPLDTGLMDFSINLPFNQSINALLTGSPQGAMRKKEDDLNYVAYAPNSPLTCHTMK